MALCICCSFVLWKRRRTQEGNYARVDIDKIGEEDSGGLRSYQQTQPFVARPVARKRSEGESDADTYVFKVDEKEHVGNDHSAQAEQRARDAEHTLVFEHEQPANSGNRSEPIAHSPQHTLVFEDSDNEQKTITPPSTLVFSQENAQQQGGQQPVHEDTFQFASSPQEDHQPGMPEPEQLEGVSGETLGADVDDSDPDGVPDRGGGVGDTHYAHADEDFKGHTRLLSGEEPHD